MTLSEYETSRIPSPQGVFLLARYRVKRRAGLLAAPLLLAVGLRAQTPKRPRNAAKSDVAALLQSAEEALGRKDFAAAVTSLKSVVAAEPNSVPAWFNLAYAYSGLNEDEEATKAYQKTLTLAPDLFEARLNLGILFIEMKQTPAALEHLEKAVALKPQHARAHLYYGRALNLAGQPDAAEKEVQAALLLDPSLAIGHYDLGQIYLGEKHFAEAASAFQKALALDSKLVQAELGLALAAEGLQKQTEAVTHFEKYLAAVPDDFETRFHLAGIYLALDQNEQALNNLLQVYRVKPKLPGLAASLGDVNALLKKFPESETFYREAVAASPGVAELHRVLGQTLLDEEKLQEAENEFRASLKLDAHDREAAKGLATSLYLQKRYQETVPLLEAFLRSPDVSPGLLFVLATCYDHLRERPKALETYEKFLELSQGKSPDQEWQARQRVKLLRRVLGK
jgi:tetratricopeptide (TPR) repeat protein